MIYLDPDDKKQGEPSPPIVPVPPRRPVPAGDGRHTLSARLRALASEAARHAAQLTAQGHESLAVRLLGAATTLEQVAAEPCAQVPIAGTGPRGPTPPLYDIRRSTGVVPRADLVVQCGEAGYWCSAACGFRGQCAHAGSKYVSVDGQYVPDR